MGTFGLSSEDIEDSFLAWLEKASLGEGDISAEAIAGAWNKIAEKMEWEDRLKSYSERG